MAEQKINNTETDTEQILRDLLKAAGAAGKTKLVAQVAQVLANPEFTKSVATTADKIYNAREYKDLRFVQAVALQESHAPGILNTLSSAELQLFTFLEHIATRGMFQVTHTQIQVILGLSRSTVRRSFANLVAKRILYIVEPATNRTAAIYRINSHICRAGKGKSVEQDLKDLEALEDWNVWEKRMTAENMIFTEAVRVGDDGRKIKYNTIDYFSAKCDQSENEEDKDVE